MRGKADDVNAENCVGTRSSAVDSGTKFSGGPGLNHWGYNFADFRVHMGRQIACSRYGFFTLEVLGRKKAGSICDETYVFLYYWGSLYEIENEACNENVSDFKRIFVKINDVKQYST